MRKKASYLVVASAVAIAFAGVAWGASHEAKADKPAQHGASTSSSLVAPALVEAEHETVSLSFDSAGRIATILVREGDRVAQGQLIATLDDRLQRAHVAKATAALSAAEARAAALNAGARPDEIRAANAEADAASALAAERARQANRAGELHSGGAIGGAQLDTDKATADSARSTAEAANARLSLLRSGARNEARREAAAAVEAAKADLEEARARLAQTELRAPRAGTVLRRNVEPGEQVTMMPPTVVVKIADVDHLLLRAEIDEADIARIAVGQQAYATAEALGGKKVTGKVVRIERELGRKKIRVDDPRARVDTRVLEASIALDEPSALPLGLRVDVHIKD